ncbi:MAG: hypothetical protein K5745_01640 [Saccharofermentans sp.]|nr:hypothetical protein [Saccharofermentans sp.]
MNKKIATLLAAAMVMTQIAGCSFLSKGKVVEAAEDFGEAIKSMDCGDIIDLSTAEDDDEVAATLDYLLDRDMYSDDENEYIDAMIDTIEVEVDSKSVSVSGDEASCDIIITMADYEDLEDGEYEEIDELVDAVADADTTEIEFTAEFVKDGDEWLVDNIDDDEFGDIFAFLSAKISVGGVAGSYMADADVTFLISEGMGVDVDFDTYLTMPFYLDLAEDGSYTLTADFETFKNNFYVWFEENTDPILYAMLGTDDPDTIETMVSASGYASYDEFKEALMDVVSESIEEEDTLPAGEDAQHSGTYTVDGANLYLDGSEDLTGTISGSEIYMSVPIPDSDEIVDLNFTKVS